jgi:hypothetical protein
LVGLGAAAAGSGALAVGRSCGCLRFFTELSLVGLELLSVGLGAVVSVCLLVGPFFDCRRSVFGLSSVRFGRCRRRPVLELKPVPELSPSIILEAVAVGRSWSCRRRSVLVLEPSRSAGLGAVAIGRS